MKNFFDMDANEFGFADCDTMVRMDGSPMTRISDFQAIDLNTGEIHMITGMGGFCDEEDETHFDWMDDEE